MKKLFLILLASTVAVFSTPLSAMRGAGGAGGHAGKTAARSRKSSLERERITLAKQALACDHAFITNLADYRHVIDSAQKSKIDFFIASPSAEGEVLLRDLAGFVKIKCGSSRIILKAERVVENSDGSSTGHFFLHKIDARGSVYK